MDDDNSGEDWFELSTREVKIKPLCGWMSEVGHIEALESETS